MSGKKRTQIAFGASPSVDLLPRRQRAELLHERTLPKLLLAIIVSGVAAALIWAAGMVPVHFADERLAAQEAGSQELLEKIAALGDVQTTTNDLERLAGQLQELGAGEVLFMELRDAVLSRLPEGSRMSSFSAELTAAEAAADSSFGGLCGGGVATLTFDVVTSGETSRLGIVSDLLDALAGVDGYLCAGFTESSTTVADGDGGTATTTTTMQLVVDETALAGRFAEGKAS